MSLRIIIMACLCGIALAANENPFDNVGQPDGKVTKAEFKAGVENWLLGPLEESAIMALFKAIDDLDEETDDNKDILDTEKEMQYLGNWQLKYRSEKKEALATSTATKQHPWDINNDTEVNAAEFLDGSKSILVDPDQAQESNAGLVFTKIDSVDTVATEKHNMIDTAKEYITLNNWIFAALNKTVGVALVEGFVASRYV